MAEIPDIKRSISATTRKPRTGEKEGIDYIFLAKEEFDNKVKHNEFLEWEKNFGHLYGTPEDQVHEAIKQGKDIILTIDVKGTKTVKEKFKDSISIFIMPPTKKELEKRLRGRNSDHETQVSIRVNESDREIESSKEYDYIVVNDDLDKAVQELVGIIQQERKKREQK